MDLDSDPEAQKHMDPTDRIRNTGLKFSKIYHSVKKIVLHYVINCIANVSPVSSRIPYSVAYGTLLV
jgi:hypothetical protein